MESAKERRFAEKVKKKGGLAIKLASPGMRSLMDRLVLIPGGKAVFAEWKDGEGKDLEDLQKIKKMEIEALGFEVVTLKTDADGDALIRKYFI